MPYVWDGHDNASRAQETGHGLKLDRYDWSDSDLLAALARCLSDAGMKSRLAATAARMQAADGAGKAARLIAELALP